MKAKREYSVFQVLAASGVAASVGALVLWMGPSYNGAPADFSVASNEESSGLQPVQMMSQPVQLRRQNSPMARIRIQDRNTIQVHYMQPELLQSIEFETTGGR